MVAVLASGEIVEFDTPGKLMARASSAFRELYVSQKGEDVEEEGFEKEDDLEKVGFEKEDFEKEESFEEGDLEMEDFKKEEL